MPEDPEDLAGSKVLPLTESELPAFAARAESDPVRRAELVDLLRKASVVPWTPAERDAFAPNWSSSGSAKPDVAVRIGTTASSVNAWRR